MPSCMRVPPELGDASSGSRSAVARSTAEVIRSAAATPIEPARKSNSQATTATRRPNTRPSPVSTDSSRPVAARGRGEFGGGMRSSMATGSGAASQLTNDPRPARRRAASTALMRLTRRG